MKPRCISIDAFYELAERESELWHLIERPEGNVHEALRENLIAHWQVFKRRLKQLNNETQYAPTQEEAAIMFIESFNKSRQRD